MTFHFSHSRAFEPTTCGNLTWYGSYTCTITNMFLNSPSIAPIVTQFTPHQFKVPPQARFFIQEEKPGHSLASGNTLFLPMLLGFFY